MLVVMLALTVFAAACYMPPRPLPEVPTVTAAAPTAVAPAAPVVVASTTAALTLDQLKNFAYVLEQAPGGKAALVNGQFAATTGAGATQKVTVTLESAAIGDLNGDGTADAAVVLATSTGGSGVFRSLHVVVNSGGKPSEAAFTFLGDRVQVKTLAIHADTAGALVVDLMTHGPKDPACCPTMEVVQTYKLQGNTLVLLSVVQKPTIRLSK